MTPNPMCAEPDTSLQQVAKMMIDCDCGGIPVCEAGSKKLVGFLTDRDIVCRILAQGINPLERTAKDAMTTDMHTIQPNASVDECMMVMQQYKVRRVPVVNQMGEIVGIVAQADLALRAARKEPDLVEEIEETIEEISEPRISV